MPWFMEEVIDLEFAGLRGLCLLVVDNTNHIRCDYRLCDFTRLKGLTFWNIVVEGQDGQT
jgi:hypothetical protein